MFIVDFRNKLVSKYCFSVVNNNDVDDVHIYSHFVQYKDYLVYLKVESEDKSYVDEILIDSENISVEGNALVVKWTMGKISTQCKKINIQLEFREGQSEESKVAQSSIVTIVLGDTIDTSEGAKHLYPNILQSLQNQIDELKVGSVSDFDLDYTNDVLTITLFNEEGEALAQLQANIPTSTKVDKIAGKGLSTNDFTDALLNKLNSIAEHAQVNVLEGVQVDGQDLPIDANKKVNIANKVTKTDSADKVYGTDGSGNQTTLPVDNVEGKDGNVARRKQTSGQMAVPLTPSANEDATSKQYVDAFGKTIELTVDPSTYVLTAKLKDANGNVLATQTVDLPLESVVVSGSYDSATQSIILVLQNGSTITIPVAGLISGLVSQADFDALALRVTTAEGNIVTLGNTKVNYNDINVSGGFVISLTKNGSTYPIAEVVNVSATPVVVQSTSDLPAQNDGNLYVVLDNGYLYAWSNGWQQLYEYTSDLLTITEVTAGEVIYSYISDKGHSNRPIQVESAVRDGEGNIINETYAKKIGYEPRLSVGSADNINSDRQIDDPEASCPPTTMGITGGEAEIKTGIENFEYMEGKSEKFNQLVINSKSGQNANVDYVLANGKMTFAGTPSVSTTFSIGVTSNLEGIKGHKYFLSLNISKNVDNAFGFSFYIWDGNTVVTATNNKRNVGEGHNVIWEATANFNSIDVGCNTVNGQVGDAEIKVQAFDLTAMFGAGNEPTTVAEFKAKYPLDYYAYNAGEILSAKVAKLISRGRQQWDEEWKTGLYNTSNGEYVENDTRICSKNFIPVIPNQEYYWHNGVGWVIFYDANGNFISSFNVNDNNNKFVTPNNCSFIHIDIAGSYGNTYKHDITISIYFEDGEDYDKYYAYSAQEVTLPNIELRSVPDYANGGEIKDIAYAQGGGKRRVGIVDLGSLNWSAITGGGSQTLFNGSIRGSGGKAGVNSRKANILCAKYTNVVPNAQWVSTTEDKTICITSDYSINVRDTSYTSASDFKSAMSGVYLVFELAEEQELTENQGWTEQVLVDNYGTLQFVTDPQQVPQVEQPYFIRYTIDLKEFLDGTYTHAQGDPQNLALKEDVEALKDDIERGDVKAGKSETADNLTPYSEDSGTTQTIPFINQGTGCGNGETQVDTGSLALMKNKQGNSKTINQVFNFTISNRSDHNLTMTVSGSATDVTLSFVANNTEAYDWLLVNSNKLTAGHKYLFFVDKPMNANFYICGFASGTAYTYNSSFGNIFTANGTDYIKLYFTAGVTGNYTFKLKLVDLTQMFGSNDNIPAYLLAHPEAFFNYYQGSLAYNAGTLVNSNATKLKTIGRNVWDEQVELGTINDSTGAKESSSTIVRSKNNIKVSPNTTYYFCRAVQSTIGIAKIYYYDVNGNYIGFDGWLNKTTFTTPANCAYILFRLDSSYGTSYLHNITISRYYEGESGYDQYYPYEVLSEIDTGNEVLRSAGSVRDYKEPNGTIHRLVNKYTFTGDEVCSFNSENETHIRFTITLALPPAKQGYNNQNNIDGGHWLQGNQITGVDSNFNALDIRPTMVIINISKAQFTGTSASQFLTWITGKTINYELEEETTEEGTPFAENVKVDDFGSMMWEGEGFNGVPMGNEIFYPIDYKAEMDTLHNHCGGDMTDIALNSELATKFTNFLKAISGYDATKTQSLKNIEGTFSWVDDE